MSTEPGPIDYPSLLKRAYLSLEKMESRLKGLVRRQAEPIAIVGLGCRFPGGAVDPDRFWRLLAGAGDGTSDVPADRWDVEAYYDPDPMTAGKMNTRRGGFLERVDRFDAQFFGISPREAVSMDPQQRLVLETVWEALEHAGQAPDRLVGRNGGFFLGISQNEYTRLFADTTEIDTYISTGNALSVAAGRVSYLLGLNGPSMAVDTACSSSLVAVHLAVQSLRADECDMALAGGVNLLLSPTGTIALSKLRMMAPDGRCKTFDAAADGFVRGEGCGIAVLKRLPDAVANGDRILALIRGSAVNQDGRSGGLTAPNGPAQEAVIRRALAAGRVAPAEVQYVEAHGTGTALGDPIEVQALAAVLGEGRRPDRPLAIGSVKTNVGHLEAAAGMAGLIKTVLALQHREIPPHLHLKNRSPHIAWNEIPVVVPTERTPWPAIESAGGNGRRIAGVSSFGFSGTNAHVVLEEAPERGEREEGEERPMHVLTLSAKSEKALRALAERYEAHLEAEKEEKFEDVCFTANTGRARLEHRLAVVAETRGEAQKKLGAYNRREEAGLRGRIEHGSEPKVAFLFTGQGSQYAGMGRRLYETQPRFREILKQCDALLEGRLERPLLKVLYPEGGEQTPIQETAYTQPALFAVEYGLAEVWRSWGVKPRVVAGHSVGEYVAACVAGVLTLEEGIRLVAERGRLMQQLKRRGTMAAVYAAESEVRRRLGKAAEVSVAAVNGPENVVISGGEEKVREVIAGLEGAGIRTQRLRVSHGFHSGLMEEMLPEFERAAEKVKYGKPQIEVVSNRTGRLVEAGEMETAGYWVRQLRETVQFSRAMETMAEQGCGVFVEIGPKPTLTALGQQCVGEEGKVWVTSLREGRDDWKEMLTSLAQLYVKGVEVSWEGFDRGYERRRVSLPTYPFQRERYWFEGGRETAFRISSISPPQHQSGDWLYQVDWRSKPLSERATPTADRPGTWLILSDRQGVGAELGRRLEDAGHSSLHIVVPEGASDFSEHQEAQIQSVIANPDTACRGVVHLPGLDDAFLQDPTTASLQTAQRSYCASALRMVQALATTENRDSPRLWIVTRGAQSVGQVSTPPQIAQSSLWGLGKVIALEHPNIWGALIDLDPLGSAGDAEFLQRELENSDGEGQVACRAGKRYVARLTKAPPQPTRKKSLTLRGDGTYLITGGLGGVGLIVARALVDSGARQLILMGRNEPGPEAQRVLAELERAGARVLTVRADVSRDDDLRKALEHASRSMPPLRGVVHAAGVLSDGILLRQGWRQFDEVMAPKVSGSWNLHRLTESSDLDFFVLFSSAAAVLGAPGQGNYAAANTFMDSLAEFRRAKGLHAVSVNWGPWAEAGMAASLEGRGGRMWDSGVMSLIPPLKGAAILMDILDRDLTRVAVLPVDWRRFSERCPSGGPALFASELTSEFPSQPRLKGEACSRIVERLDDTSPSNREEVLREYLQQQIEGILRLEGQVIPGDRSLIELGFDSLMVMELLNIVQRDMQLTLYPREFYDRPSIKELAAYLSAEIARNRGEAQEQALPAPQGLAVRTPMSPVGPTAKTEAETPGGERLPAITFLLSSPRAGSTLLRVMLAGHPKLFCPPELHLLLFKTMSERRSTLASSYLGEGLQRAFMELKGIGAEESQRLVDDLAERGISTRKVYSMLQELAGARHVVDKSPTYAASLETLARAEDYFDGARYIHLVRHPYAVIESFVRKRMDRLISRDNVDPYALAEQIWATSNNHLLQFLTPLNAGRHHLVRYEELVRDPEGVLRRLCVFLNIPFDEAVVKPYEGRRMTDGVHAKSLPIGDPGFLNRRIIEPELSDVWKSIRLPRKLAAPSRKLAAAFGYVLAEEESTISSGYTVQPGSGDGTMRERQIEIRGLRLCLCEWGPADGPLIVCLHGILDQGASWAPVAMQLAGRGFRVVAPDQRGHGLSDHVGTEGGYHLLDFLADLDAVVRDLGKPLTLVAHSMGAALAAMLAAARPNTLNGLVLIECPFPSDRTHQDIAQRIATQLNYAASPPLHPVFPTVTAAASRMRQAIPSLPEELAIRLAARITISCAGGLRWRWDPRLQTRAGIAFQESGIANSAGFLEMLREIRVPVALIWAKDSGFVKAEKRDLVQQAIAHSTRIGLAGGHNLHLEASSEVAEVVAGLPAPQ